MSNSELELQELARAVALRQLSLAPKTRAQLAKAIDKKGVPAEVAEAVLDRLEEVDLVDDAAFARQWVESRQAGRGLARRALGHELRQRGVEEPLVQEALELVSTECEVDTARELVRRRLAQSGPVTRENKDKIIRRLGALLARKGYGPGLAARVIREELGRCGQDDLSALDDLG